MIQNTKELSRTSGEKIALQIAESAYEAIDTAAAVKRTLSVENQILYAGDRSYDLTAFSRIRVIGFGKASCKAVEAAESVLKTHLSGGVAIDIRPGTCEIVDVVGGTHPRPSQQNVDSTGRIVNIANESEADDLVIVIVSGGGSSLLCWPYDECEQGTRLYDDFLSTGATIEEMNTVRKHISAVKGGGLATLLSPATVVALVFCDVPGDRFEDVASGPTYFDSTTIADAEKILHKYQLTGYQLLETPKDRSLFERVQNIPLVSNTRALAAMSNAAKDLGFEVISIGADRYDTPRTLVETMRNAARAHSVVIAGGEPKLVVTKKGGHGGRCQYVALEALRLVSDHETFLAFASDGHDNSDSAGALATTSIRDTAEKLGLSVEDSLANFDTYSFFEKSNGMIMTGPTDANVSDLFVLVRES